MLRADGCGATHACDAGGVRAKLILADVALGVGIASLRTAIGLTIARQRGASVASAPAAESMAPAFAWQAVRSHGLRRPARHVLSGLRGSAAQGLGPNALGVS